jgi:hypothetical protein
MIRYEKGADHYFQFRTLKGDRGVVVDKRGLTRHCFEEDRTEALPGEITHQEAVNKALFLTGDGRVEMVRTRKDGYEVDIDLGEKGTYRVFVDREGMVHEQKCSQLSRNLAADLE